MVFWGFGLIWPGKRKTPDRIEAIFPAWAGQNLSAPGWWGGAKQRLRYLLFSVPAARRGGVPVGGTMKPIARRWVGQKPKAK